MISFVNMCKPNSKKLRLDIYWHFSKNPVFLPQCTTESFPNQQVMSCDGENGKKRQIYVYDLPSACVSAAKRDTELFTHLVPVDAAIWRHQEWLLETQITQKPGSNDSSNYAVNIIKEELCKRHILHGAQPAWGGTDEGMKDFLAGERQSDKRGCYVNDCNWWGLLAGKSRFTTVTFPWKRKKTMFQIKALQI